MSTISPLKELAKTLHDNIKESINLRQEGEQIYLSMIGEEQFSKEGLQILEHIQMLKTSEEQSIELIKLLEQCDDLIESGNITSEAIEEIKMAFSKSQTCMILSQIRLRSKQ